MVAAKLTLNLASPLTGFLSDVIGPGYTMSISILLGIPWSAILVLKKSVALFIVALAFESEHPALVRVVLFMYMTFRFLPLGLGPSGGCGAGGHFSRASRCRMQVPFTFMSSFTDFVVLQMPTYMGLSI